ncbi:MAG: hypothetical protein GX957_03620 [Clostridiaceae bacterium]|nr:hypothetical protein [Clostridiaceae bacterium]
MEKTISINGKSVNFKASGGCLIKYRQQFGVEYSDDIERVRALKDTNADEETIKILLAEVYYKLMWCMAKTADNSIPDPESWAKEFGDYDISEAMVEINDLLSKSIGDNEDDEGDGEPFRSESFINCCLICNLTMQDIENMSIGLLMKTVKEHIDMKSSKTNKKEKVSKKKASQSDFDNFNLG